MPKPNHRSAFASNAAFMKRIESQIERPTVGSFMNQEHPSLPSEPVTKKVSKAGLRAKKVVAQNMESRFDRVRLDEATGVLVATFTGAALLGLNIMLRMHDAQGTSLKNTWFKRVQALTYDNHEVFSKWRDTVNFPLIVEEVYVTAESTPLDSESVCAACKPIIDSFVRCGWLPDDSTRYISHPIPYTFRGANSGVIITLRPSPEAHGLISATTIEAAHDIGQLPDRA